MSDSSMENNLVIQPIQSVNPALVTADAMNAAFQANSRSSRSHIPISGPVAFRRISPGTLPSSRSILKEDPRLALPSKPLPRTLSRLRSNSSADRSSPGSSDDVRRTNMGAFNDGHDAAGWKARWEAAVAELEAAKAEAALTKRTLATRTELLTEANVELTAKRAAERAVTENSKVLEDGIARVEQQYGEIRMVAAQLAAAKEAQPGAVEHIVQERLQEMTTEIRSRANEDCGPWQYNIISKEWDLSSQSKAIEQSPARVVRPDGSVLFLPWSRSGVTAKNITGLDALVLAQIKNPAPTSPQNAHLVIYSPNMNFVPHPLVGPRVVQGRADGNFALEDFRQHPQYFDYRVPYLFAIYRRPTGEGKNSFLWRSLQDTDAIVAYRPGYQGSHQLIPSAGALLVEKANELANISSQLFKELPERDRLSHLITLPRHLLTLAFALNDSVHTMRNMRYMLCAYQRYYLECLAVYDYCKVWLPRLRLAVVSNEPNEVEVHTELMGSVTDDPLTAMKLFALGIPVWQIRPSVNLSLSTSIIKIVRPEATTVVMEQANPPFPILWKGPAGPACSLAAQDLVIGGLSFGLGTRRGLTSLVQSGSEGRSRMLDVADGEEPVHPPSIEDVQDFEGDASYDVPSQTPADVSSGEVAAVDSVASVASSSTSLLPPTPFVASTASVPSKSKNSRWAQYKANKPPARAPIVIVRDHNWLPGASRAWEEGLTAINNLQSRVCSDSSGDVLRNRYIYPPIHVLLGSKSREYLMIWATIRPRWQGELSSGSGSENPETSTLPPSAKHWGLEFRSIAKVWYDEAFKRLVEPPPDSHLSERSVRARTDDYRPSSRSSSHWHDRHTLSRPSTSQQESQGRLQTEPPVATKKGVSGKKRKARLEEETEKAFKFLDIEPIPPISLEYQKMPVYSQNEELSTTVARLLVWDVVEANWRADVILLDRALVPALWDTDPHRRQAQVETIFPDGAYAPRFPLQDTMVSLGGPSFLGVKNRSAHENELMNERIEYLCAFQRLIRVWPGSHNSAKLQADPDTKDENGLILMQHACFKFYCQAFFDQFGRAPTVPRYLPDGWG